MIPPLSAWLSTLFDQDCGKAISKAPKKEIAKTTKSIKKITLNQTLVDRAFKESAPKSPTITDPNNT